jgi:hypothetical protein
MRFLFILLVFMCYEGHAQVWHIKRAIQFDQRADAATTDFLGFISFTGEVSAGPESDLPYYSELLDWSSDHPAVRMNIVFTGYETFMGIIPDSSRLINIADSLTYSYTLEFMKKKPFLQIKLLPFRKNPENGRLERLKTFVIRLEDQEPPVRTTIDNKKSVSFDNSVLNSGLWYKIKVPSSGIYRLSYEQISSMSIGDPANVRIFGFGGEVLPEDCRQGEKDDLMPVQTDMIKGSDGIFNAGDFLLFYSRGSIKWDFDKRYGMFRHQLNPYSDYSYYFVTSGTGPDLPLNEAVPASDASLVSDSYDYRTFHELESENVLLSGKQWFGENFSLTQQQTFSFVIPGLLPEKPLEILAQVMAKSTEVSSFLMSFNNVNIDTFVIQAANLSDYTSIFGFTTEQKIFINPSSNSISLKLKYIKPDGTARGWLDYIIINARASLKMQTDFLEFRDLNVSGAGNITQFTLGSANANTILWDVSNQNDIRRITGNLSGTQLVFKVATDYLREFVAFNENGNYPVPVLQGSDVGLIPNQNLHGPQQPDMVIISYAGFLEQAERLAAYRREKNGLDVLVVTPGTIYNEFSSGTPDISAYRNFMKMLYSRAGSDSTLLPQYLLLFGDGTYDNKGITENATNYTLTYQSDNSLSPTSSYVSDDFFALLDPGENMISGLLDIGVGRLPVGTKEEAESMVDKILNYELPARMGDWRNVLCFIGDDEDGNIHMTDADALAQYVESNYPGFNINKIYLDAYKQVSTPSGQRYPDVNLAINDQVTRGALIINYTGHGGIKGWAHELILGLNDIDSWNNSGRLPLFMTATCEFSRYDDHQVPSAGEKVLLNPNGGGIALFTTTRLVYSQPNRVLNEKFYQIVFEKDKDGNNYRLGDIMQYTKNQSGSGINKRNFALLGDPSQRLSYPEYFVYADSLNGKSINTITDTLQALRKVTISGHVADMGGNTLTGFNGQVYPTVYDKAILQQTLANDGGSKKTFSIRNNILYKGKSTVQNGMFHFTFMVPKDINYTYGSGRLSFYADDSLVDASGAYNGITIGGTFPDAETDPEGPELNVFMNSPTFRSGGITDENPMLYVEVSDKYGVNTTGNGIGHDITAMLDDNSQNTFILNGYFQSYLDSYQGGLIRYPFNKLEPGHHVVSVKVWDIYNNSSSGSTDFIVIKSNDLLLEDLLNCPNPFSDYTNISFAHNKPGVTMDITVDIFNMEGKLIRTIKAKEPDTGYRSQNIYWDGSGAQNGQSLYIYRIRVKTSDGQAAEKSGKLIILR